MNELTHHGILGQKWGIRRYQNEDGSLTPEGRKRYYDENGQLTSAGEKARKKEYKNLTKRYHVNSFNGISKGDNGQFSSAYAKYTVYNRKSDRDKLEIAARNAIKNVMGQEAFNKPLNDLLKNDKKFKDFTSEGEYFVQRTLWEAWE